MALNVLKAALPERLPTTTQLLSNYPNPFNPETWIPYQLNQASDVSLSVYSSECKLLRQLDLGLKPAGNYQTTKRALYWDGRNTNGEPAPRGLYFYRLQAGDCSQTRQLVFFHQLVSFGLIQHSQTPVPRPLALPWSGIVGWTRDFTDWLTGWLIHLTTITLCHKIGIHISYRLYWLQSCANQELYRFVFNSV